MPRGQHRLPLRCQGRLATGSAATPRPEPVLTLSGRHMKNTDDTTELPARSTCAEIGARSVATRLASFLGDQQHDARCWSFCHTTAPEPTHTFC
jgi:hypothetical protein